MALSVLTEHANALRAQAAFLTQQADGIDAAVAQLSNQAGAQAALPSTAATEAAPITTGPAPVAGLEQAPAAQAQAAGSVVSLHALQQKATALVKAGKGQQLVKALGDFAIGAMPDLPQARYAEMNTRLEQELAA